MLIFCSTLAQMVTKFDPRSWVLMLTEVNNDTQNVEVL